MDTFDYSVRLKVTIDAFTEEDAREMIEDVFGPGSDCGVEVTDCEIVLSEPAKGIITTTTIKQKVN